MTDNDVSPNDDQVHRDENNEDRGYLEDSQPPAAPRIDADSERHGEGRPPLMAPEPSPGIPWRLGLFLLLATLVVVFAVQNTQEVGLEFLAWEWRLPLVIIILITVVVSVILDEVLGGIIKRRRTRRRREREELSRLREMG